MTENQFVLRLLLTIIVGIAFSSVMARMAVRNSSPSTRTKLGFKIIGGVFILLGIVSGFIALFTPVEHSSTTLAAMTRIVRPSTSHLYWGYPTPSQNVILSNLMNLFIMFAYGIYFWRFRKSSVVWWKKMLKVLSMIVMTLLMFSSTNLHYFDWWELLPNILLIVIIYCNFKFTVNTSNINKESERVSITASDTTGVTELNKSSDIVFENEDVEL